MANRNNPFDFIDAVIDPIPGVGQIWADAMYTVLGLSDAFNMRKFGTEFPPLPAASNVFEFTPKPEAERLSKAA